MATTTPTPLQFKSYKGGERRAEFEGLLYSIKRRGDSDTIEVSVRYPGDKQFTDLGSGSTFEEAAVVATTHATTEDPEVEETEDAPHLAPSFVQQGSGDETLKQVLDSISGLDDDAEVAQAVTQGVIDTPERVADRDAKAAKKEADQVKRAAKAAAPKVAAPAVDPVELVFAPFKGDNDEHRAKGARHAYRIAHAQAGGFYAQQRTCAWTNIAGKCNTFDEARDLAQRYENGAKQLSHRALIGVAYAKAIAALDGSK